MTREPAASSECNERHLVGHGQAPSACRSATLDTGPQSSMTIDMSLSSGRWMCDRRMYHRRAWLGRATLCSTKPPCALFCRAGMCLLASICCTCRSSRPVVEPAASQQLAGAPSHDCRGMLTISNNLLTLRRCLDDLLRPQQRWTDPLVVLNNANVSSLGLHLLSMLGYCWQGCSQ
jgi:hypothetical protein